MSVLINKDTALLSQDSTLLNGEGVTRQLDLSVTGSNGALRLNHHWVSNASYVQQKIIAVLISVPKAIKYLDDPTKQTSILKSLVETWPQSIDGMNSSVTWEFGEVATGHSGEMFESVVNSKRERSVPTFVWSEKYGVAIAKFITNLFEKVLLDPDLGVPGVVNESKYIDAGSPVLLPEDQALTILFIEPDKNMRNVTKAWLTTNMMPKTGGDLTGKREVGGSGEVPEVSIEWTGLTDQGAAVYLMANRYLASLALNDLKPFDKETTFTDNGEEVASADVTASTNGFASAISDDGAN